VFAVFLIVADLFKAAGILDNHFVFSDVHKKPFLELVPLGVGPTVKVELRGQVEIFALRPVAISPFLRKIAVFERGVFAVFLLYRQVLARPQNDKRVNAEILVERVRGPVGVADILNAASRPEF